MMMMMVMMVGMVRARPAVLEQQRRRRPWLLPPNCCKKTMRRMKLSATTAPTMPPTATTSTSSMRCRAQKLSSSPTTTTMTTKAMAALPPPPPPLLLLPTFGKAPLGTTTCSSAPEAAAAAAAAEADPSSGYGLESAGAVAAGAAAAAAAVSAAVAAMAAAEAASKAAQVATEVAEAARAAAASANDAVGAASADATAAAATSAVAEAQKQVKAAQAAAKAAECAAKEATEAADAADVATAGIPHPDYTKLTPEGCRKLLRERGFEGYVPNYNLVEALKKSEKVDKFLPETLVQRVARNFVRVLHSTLLNSAFLPAGGEVGFFCMHLYEHERQLPQRDLDSRVRCSDLRLKGQDAIMAVAMSRMGLKVTVLRVVNLSTADDEDMSCTKTLCDPKTAKKQTRQTIIQQEYSGAVLDPDSKVPDNFYLRSLEEIRWAVSAEDGAQRAILHNFETSYTDNYGNESCSGTLYTSVALCLQVPPFTERKEQLEQLSEDIFTGAFDRCIEDQDENDVAPESDAGGAKKVQQNANRGRQYYNFWGVPVGGDDYDSDEEDEDEDNYVVGGNIDPDHDWVHYSEEDED
eukprot:m.198274 g.198274  ORF g.198274 m.198274 type:complete len:579 (+) comp21875_c1_seq2:1-1737(+)